MHLYHVVHFDQLEHIIDNGLGIRLGETESIPIILEVYPQWAEGRRIIRDYKRGVENLIEETVVLCVEMGSIECSCEEYLKTEHGNAIRYICTDVIDSSDLFILWADNVFPLEGFLTLCNKLKCNGFAADSSEALMKCVQWYTMGAEKRKAIFDIMGGWRARHIDDLVILTGYSADQLISLWRQHEASIEYYVSYKGAYEKGLIKGLYESGCSIEEIAESVKWRKQDVEEILKEKD